MATKRYAPEFRLPTVSALPVAVRLTNVFDFVLMFYMYSNHSSKCTVSELWRRTDRGRTDGRTDRIIRSNA